MSRGCWDGWGAGFGRSRWRSYAMDAHGGRRLGQCACAGFRRRRRRRARRCSSRCPRGEPRCRVPWLRGCRRYTAAVRGWPGGSSRAAVVTEGFSVANTQEPSPGGAGQLTSVRMAGGRTRGNRAGTCQPSGVDAEAEQSYARAVEVDAEDAPAVRGGIWAVVSPAAAASARIRPARSVPGSRPCGSPAALKASSRRLIWPCVGSSRSTSAAVLRSCSGAVDRTFLYRHPDPLERVHVLPLPAPQSRTGGWRRSAAPPSRPISRTRWKLTNASPH